jgi:hypothetical protein
MMISSLDTDLEGLTGESFIMILPFLHASEAMLLVLKILTDQRNLSILTGLLTGMMELLFIL